MRGLRAQHAPEGGVSVDKVVFQCAQGMESNAAEQDHGEPVVGLAGDIGLLRQISDQGRQLEPAENADALPLGG